ncbi:MAG: VanW family protein [Clostridia bacterium]|nr:VanW family protein [Clostridia bacterium]
MKARKKKELKRRRNMERIILGCGAAVVVLALALLVINLLIKGEHKRAVKEYQENNWVNIENIPGGKSYRGMSNGENFSYVDDGTYFGGIFVDGVELKGMDYDEARNVLVKVVEDKLNDINIVVTVGDACLALSANDFNVQVNVNDILESAHRLGRENINDFAANYRKQQSLLTNPVEYSIEYTIDRDRIAQRVSNIADFVNTKPKEPYVTVSQRPSANDDSQVGDDAPVIRDSDTIVQTVYADNGKAIAYIYYNPGKNGFVLDQEDLVERIANAFESGDFDCVISAELEETSPEKTAADIKDSVVCITSYTTEFDHDERDMNRCRNIQKAAGILNACVVKPGKEISFNKYVGPRTEEGGWLRAHGIVNGREYEDSPGGGICQVSGTLYNALLQCGPNKIKIKQRQHHSWPSSYLPFGLDATVDTNGPDLKWKNISDSTLYIFTYADIKKGKMYVYVYGEPEPDGSYYETYAEIIEEIIPEEPVIIEQSQWPTGYQRTTITERIGYKTKSYLNHFSKDGELINTIYLYSDYYYPVRGEITVGTGPSYLPKPKK